MTMNKERRLYEGEHVVAADPAGLRIAGKVEEVAPHLDAAWVREDGVGARRLIMTGDLLDPAPGTHD
ncbi:hypothetical protein NCCP1664_17500 [Zafaria cholistanensis]|uniref:Uncharacterized protein n=1 Tax=Zafaria cholistanensis TaxID=1682741 RepID=A0A5A7NQN8_9MICC|nr:hypothetical protein [Zafaria cholistanensis]GER23254.1 hypothetical protein NCCP1664_17500 [Zafaria cholistanensis]